MNYAIYQSRALIPDTFDANDAILAQSIRNNAMWGVTGFLHREGDCFLQYLEAEETMLEMLLTRIWKDPRHTNTEVIAEGRIGHRLFPDWQMGYLGAGLFKLTELLEVEPEGWRFLIDDPFDLVVFMASNADILRSSAA